MSRPPVSSSRDPLSAAQTPIASIAAATYAATGSPGAVSRRRRRGCAFGGALRAELILRPGPIFSTSRNSVRVVTKCPIASHSASASGSGSAPRTSASADDESHVAPPEAPQ